MFKPRFYQLSCLQATYKNFKTVSNRSLLCAATGTGKTVMGAIMARNAVERGLKVNFFVPRTPLINQTLEKMTLQGLTCGIVAGDFSGLEKPSAPVQIISVQTLYGDRPLDWLPQGRGTLNIVDECHITQFYRVLKERFPQVDEEDHSPSRAEREGYLVGMTGTLWRRKPTESLGQFFSRRSLVLAPMPSYLIEEGYLVNPVYYRMEKLTRNLATSTQYALEQWKKVGQRSPTLAFCPSVPFARELTKVFDEAGFPSALITAKTPRGVREDIFEKFDQGKLLMLASKDVLSEGFDSPKARCGMFLRDTENPSKYYQQLGRLVRPYTDPETGWTKTDAIMMDFVNIVSYGRLEDLQVTVNDLDVEEAKVKKGQIPLKPCVNESCNALNIIQAKYCYVCYTPFVFVGKEKVLPTGDMFLDLTDKEKPQYAYYQRLLKSCYYNEVSPEQALHQFYEVYERFPPNAWNNCAVLGKDASKEEKRKYARYLAQVSEATSKPKQWLYHQLSLNLDL